MKYIIFLVAAIALTGSSCKKGQSDLNIVLSFTNASYGGSLEGVTITVSKLMAGTTDLVPIGTYTSNALGQLSFTTKRDKFDYLAVSISKNNYFGSEEKIYLSELNSNKDNTFTYNLTGKAWAAIHLKSTTSGNTVIIHKNGGKTGCDECCPNVDLHFSSPIDTVFYCINNANTSFSYEYYINNGATTGQKTAITEFADSTEILLNF